MGFFLSVLHARTIAWETVALIDQNGKRLNTEMKQNEHLAATKTLKVKEVFIAAPRLANECISLFCQNCNSPSLGKV